MRLLYGVAALPFLTLLAEAKQLKVTLKVDPVVCSTGCIASVTNVLFSDGDPKAKKGYNYCGSEFAETSMAICMLDHCSDPYWADGNTASWKDEQSDCKKQKLKMASWKETLLKVNESRATALRDVDIWDTTIPVYNSTILLSQESFNNGFNSYYNKELQKNIIPHAFGTSMYAMVGLMLLFGIVQRIVTVFQAKSYQPASVKSSTASRMMTIYMKYLGSPALIGGRHARPWGWSQTPTRVQTLFISIYVISNIIFTCVGISKPFDHNLIYPTKQLQLVRYIGDRNARLCFWNLPLLFLLAGRNDFFLWLTGWSYNQMNMFHRWVAKVTVLQAFLHSIAFGIYYTTMPGKHVSWKDLYWATGIMAITTMGLILPLSIYPIRKRVYEFFLAAHVVLALTTLVLLFFHVTIQDKGQYDAWLWVCSGVWVFERLARIARMLIFSHTALLSKTSNTVATMTSDSKGLIRITVTVKSIPWGMKPQPGQHYFIYTPKQLTFWENHPFSLASWNTTDQGTELHFLMAPQKGTTRRLQRLLSRTSDGTANMRLLIEGPYGHAENLRHYDHLLLVAGGSGITAVLPYLYEITDSPESYIATHVVLVWTVKNLDYAKDVLSRELVAILDSRKVEVRIHLTSDEESSADLSLPVNTLGQNSGASSSTAINDVIERKPTNLDEQTGAAELEEKADSVAGSASQQFEARPGRPFMEEVLRIGIKSLGQHEKLGLLACGPAGMTDDLRNAVCEAYGDGEGQVHANRLTYMEEHFSW